MQTIFMVASSVGARGQGRAQFVPGIGEVREVPGFILAAGFSGHGFGIGPGAGHLIADLVTGDNPIFDPVPFRPERFNKSSWGKVADF